MFRRILTAGLTGDDTDIGFCPPHCLAIQISTIVKTYVIEPECFAALGVRWSADTDIALALKPGLNIW